MKTLNKYIRDINISTTLNERSILGDVEDTLINGEADINKSLGIPEIKDFYIPRSWPKASFIFWECAKKLKRYRQLSWCPYDSAGITFELHQNSDGSFSLYGHFNTERGRFYLADATKNVKGWCTHFEGKNRTYCKKVVLSLIEHLAKNPSAFNHMINYIREVVRHKQLSSKYDDGTTMKIKDFMELFDITN